MIYFQAGKRYYWGKLSNCNIVTVIKRTAKTISIRIGQQMDTPTKRISVTPDGIEFIRQFGKGINDIRVFAGDIVPETPLACFEVGKTYTPYLGREINEYTVPARDGQFINIKDIRGKSYYGVQVHYDGNETPEYLDGFAIARILATSVKQQDTGVCQVNWGLYNELCKREKDKEDTVSWNRQSRKG